MNYTIYTITHTDTGRVYVGQTCLPVETRWAAHKHGAKNHRIRITSIAQAIREHDISQFTFKVIAIGLGKSEAVNRERYWIAHYKSLPSGVFNITNGNKIPTPHPTPAKRGSPEHRDKISASQTARHARNREVGITQNANTIAYWASRRKTREADQAARLERAHQRRLADPKLMERFLARHSELPGG